MSDVTLEPPEFEFRQKIELEVKDGKLEGIYVTFIEQPGGEEIRLQVPRVEELYLPLQEDQPVTLSYKKLSARYEFDGEVASRDEGRKVPSFSVNRPDRVKRIQMRDYLRVPCEISAQMELLGGLKSDNLPDRVNGKVVDISGGGVRFKTAIPVPPSQRVHLELDLSLIDEKIDFVPGKVIRRDKDEVTGKYFLGIEFTEITIDDKNDIIQYVYRQQIEMDKKDKWVRE